MAEWVENNGTYTYMDDDYIAVVSAVECNGDDYYGYEICENNENPDISWSNIDDGIGYYYDFPLEAMERVEAIIKELED